MDRLADAFFHSTEVKFNFKLQYSQILGIPEDKCLTTISNGIEFASALSEVVARNKTVKHLVFDGIPLGMVAFHQIMRALMANALGHIESLSFRECILEATDAEEVAEFIRASAVIAKVDLSVNELRGNTWIESLVDALQVNRSLKSLDLSGNNLSGCNSIVDIIFSPGLDKLCLKAAFLGSEVFERMAENIGRLSLSELYLDYNDRINICALSSISRGLRDNKKLIALNLPRASMSKHASIEDIIIVHTVESEIFTLLQRNCERFYAREGGSVEVVRSSILDSVPRDVQPVLASGGVDGGSSDLRRRAISEAAPMLDCSRAARDVDVRDEEEPTAAEPGCWSNVLNCCRRQQQRRR